MKNKNLVNLVVFIAGLAALAAGIYMIYPPAAFIAVGVVLMGITVIGGDR